MIQLTISAQYRTWFDRQVTKQASQDKLRRLERIYWGVAMVAVLGVVVTFLKLYTSNSGFYTSEFTIADAALLFWIAFLAAITKLLKAVLGTKNSTRPLEVLLYISIFVAAAYFVFKFPFDFSNIGVGKPESLQFLYSLITDRLVKVLLVIIFIGDLFLIPYTAMLYLEVRRKLGDSGGDGGPPVQIDAKKHLQ